MPTVIEFLDARIDEDVAEASAYAVLRFDPQRGYPVYQGVQARVLAECETKRRIMKTAMTLLDEGRRDREYGSPWPGVPLDGRAAKILYLLALPYADHPDYDEAWRP